MSMFSRIGRAAERPPGSGDRFPLWLNLKNGSRIAGWFEPKAGRYMKSPQPGTADPSTDIHDDVDTWEVRRDLGSRTGQ